MRKLQGNSAKNIKWHGYKLQRKSIKLFLTFAALKNILPITLSDGKTITLPGSFNLAAKLQDYAQLAKLRLASLVVFSAVMGFVIGSIGTFEWSQLWLLVLGGFLVTASSNAFNQVLEKDFDKLMDRTSQRPLPAGRMSVGEAVVVAAVMGIAGVAILWIYMNPLCGMLGALSLGLYVLLYTPLKRVTPLAVFVGAIPGAMPPLLGWVAARGEIGFEALLLYTIQFIWQFPHFWSIAWVLDDDYKKAGFKLMPSPGGRDHSSAFQTMVYSICLIPLGLMPYMFHMGGLLSTAALIICGFVFTIPSFRLYKTLSMESARKVMFSSFMYLPVVQIVWMLDRIFK